MIPGILGTVDPEGDLKVADFQILDQSNMTGTSYRRLVLAAPFCDLKR